MKKVISNTTKQLKKLTPKLLLENKIVLYIVAAIAIVNLLTFANKKDYNSVLIFIIIGFLISFFSKNMIVIFLSAILFTHAFKYVLGNAEGMKNKKKEGLENKDGEEEENEDEENADGDEEEEVIKAPVKTDADKEQAAIDKKKQTYDELKNDFSEFQSIQKDILKNMKEIDPLLNKAENFIEKFESYKKKK